jgi:hypothetical protein
MGACAAPFDVTVCSAVIDVPRFIRATLCQLCAVRVSTGDGLNRRVLGSWNGWIAPRQEVSGRDGGGN